MSGSRGHTISIRGQGSCAEGAGYGVAPHQAKTEQHHPDDRECSVLCVGVGVPCVAEGERVGGGFFVAVGVARGGGGFEVGGDDDFGLREGALEVEFKQGGAAVGFGEAQPGIEEQVKFDKKSAVDKSVAELVITFDLMGSCVGVEALKDAIGGFLVGAFHQALIGFCEQFPSRVEDMESNHDSGDGIEDTDVGEPHQPYAKDACEAGPHIGEDVHSVGAEDRRLMLFSDGEQVPSKSEIDRDQSDGEQKSQTKAL